MPERHQIEFFGVLQGNLYSEIEQPTTTVDATHVREYARLHEEVGFDGMLVGTSAVSEDSLVMATCAAQHTHRLRFLVAHRPAPVLPALAARQFATFDQLSGGRLHVHVISSRDGDSVREGDTLDKDQRYARAGEHIRFLRQAWEASEPFDFDGEFYQAEDYVSRVKPLQSGRVEISFAGNSAAAQRVGASLADSYALYARPLADQAEDIATLRQLAAESGRTDELSFTMIVRPVLAATDELAWERAEQIKQKALHVTNQPDPQQMHMARRGTEGQQSVGDLLQAELNELGERHDTALWTGISGITGRGNSTALVGSPDTVAAALLAYHEIGIDRFIVYGFDSYADARSYGQDLIPLVRQKAEERAR